MSALQPFSRVAGLGEPGLRGGPNKTVSVGNLGTWDKNSVAVIHTVNEALVSVISKQYSRDKFITVPVGQLVVAGLKYNIVC